MLAMSIFLPQIRNFTYILCVLTVLSSLASGAVERRKFSIPDAYLIVEVLDDDLIHFELSPIGSGPPLSQALYTSPMVHKTNYIGPSAFSDLGNQLETADLRLTVNTSDLCVEIKDKRQSNARLTRLCPKNLSEAFKGLDIERGSITQVYGLGQQFKTLGSADGDWIQHGVRVGEDNLGNGFPGFQDARVGNVQIPVYYAVGDNGVNYALFMDNVYHQKWEFNTSPWRARMFGDQLRWYVMSGADLPDLRSDFMELVGTPPVPPRKLFGLWISEFGYDNFDQIDTLLNGLRANHFPIDGFVLDLNWFGGVVPNDKDKSTMGRLNWDEDQAQPSILSTNPYSFPNPGAEIQKYHNDNIALTVIEESYLANKNVDTFRQMPSDLNAYQRTRGVCNPSNQTQPIEIDATDFFGIARMIDWSDPKARVWIHDNRRFPNLTKKGVTSHWTDLGEPERKDTNACYEGVETTVSGLKNKHSDIHNLYNLLWVKGIWDGYAAHQGQANDLGITNPRPFILTRSGTAGVQRYGVGMWTGDIASNLQSLATAYNTQMHMSFSGIDYHGSDVGGFRREVLPHNNKQGAYRGFEGEMYTQWLADALWTDVPVRPHTDNEFNPVSPPYATAPHLVGKKASNLANVRQRYELIPYYYSLAHLAHQTGSPVVPPPVYYFQSDPNLRGLGHEKMIGRDLLLGIVARHGEYERDVYLPAGRWANYHSNEWVQSSGEFIKDVPVYREGILRIPAFARAGAILPKMAVDADTKDAFGHRKAGATPRDELIVRVYPDAQQTSFTLFEDDGQTLKYDPNGRPFYHHRTTKITQHQNSPSKVSVTIDPAVNVNGNGQFPGAVPKRQNVVELVVDNAEATSVTLGTVALQEHPTRQSFDAASSGWVNAGRNLVLAKSASTPVTAIKSFEFVLQGISEKTSVNFVCDNGVTQPSQSIFVVGSIPELGNWNPANSIKLDPNIYYAYIHSPPPGGQNEGPKQPVWTGVVAELPSQPSFEWKCIRLNDDGSGTPSRQPGPNNIFSSSVASGYAGRAFGKF
jgi:alpha-glucosidase (family GH31 glycosyl hydrolase)